MTLKQENKDTSNILFKNKVRENAMIINFADVYFFILNIKNENVVCVVNTSRKRGKNNSNHKKITGKILCALWNQI